jgi:hypothetical protein
MKKIFLLSAMVLVATILWGQGQQKQGLKIIYRAEGVQTEQTFALDSVIDWGYDKNSDKVFVNSSGSTPSISIPTGELVQFEYPEIYPDAETADYFVVNVDGQKAAFRLGESFEFTWSGGVLDIKDKSHSQKIGLKKGITFTIESLSFGFGNPNISPTPGSGSFYLVTEYAEVIFSFDDNSHCIYEINSFGNPCLSVSTTGATLSLDTDNIKNTTRKLYISDKVIGKLWYNF